jgi:hypothetical protein
MMKTINVPCPLNLAWRTPESWRQLKEAVAAAGMPKDRLAGS